MSRYIFILRYYRKEYEKNMCAVVTTSLNSNAVMDKQEENAEHILNYRKQRIKMKTKRYFMKVFIHTQSSDIDL